MTGTNRFRSRRRSIHQSPLLRMILTSALLVAAALSTQAEGLSAQQIAEIQRISAAALTKNGPPGLGIAVAKGGQVWSAGFGRADLEQNVAVDAHSMFRTASISKWLTATAALRLAES